MEAEKTTNKVKVITRNVLLVMAVHFLSQCGGGMINSVQGQLGKSLELTATVIGMVATLYTLVAMFVRIPSGSLIRYIDIKKLVGGLALVRVLIAILFAFTNNGALYAISRLLNGATWAAAGVIMAALMSILVDKKLLGTFYSAYLAISYGGKLLVRPWAIATFTAQGNVRLIGFVAAGCFLAAAAVAMLFDEKDENLKMVRIKQEGKAKRSFNIFAGLCVPAVPMMIIVCSAITCFNVEMLFMPVMTEEAGISPTAALSVAAVITVVAMFALGTLCDVINPTIIVTLSLICQGLGMIFMARATNDHQFFIWYVIYAVGNRWDIPFNVWMLKRVSKESMPGVTATMLTIQDIWSALCTTIFGAVVQHFGYGTAFFFPGLFCFIGAAYILLFGKKSVEKIAAAENKGSEATA
ncbi:MAG: MFS transporter [Mogibacterium sp.]|nr:MFS transporter [Mogibacterium sp.]